MGGWERGSSRREWLGRRLIEEKEGGGGRESGAIGGRKRAEKKEIKSKLQQRRDRKIIR